MSKHDEFQDLERRLRENRPSTEPLPSDVKRRLRADLMEKATVNDERGFTFGTLTAAAGAVLVLIGIPLLFWMIQGSRPLQEPVAGGPVSATRQGAATAVATGVADAAAPEAAPTEAAPDRVWVIASDPGPGTAVNRAASIQLTLGYELNSADAARLTAKLTEAAGAESGRGVGEASAAVAAGEGSVTLTLSADETLSPEASQLGLWLTLQPEAGERPFFTAFPEAYTWPLAAAVETAQATADIVAIGAPQRHTNPDGPPDMINYHLPITVAYTLDGIDEALLWVEYEHRDADGTAAGSDSRLIRRGEGQATSRLFLPGQVVDGEGALAEDVEISVRINAYDEAAEAYVNLYPGVELPPQEKNAPYPHPSVVNIVSISAVHLDPAAAEPTLTVDLVTHLNTMERGDLTVSLADGTSSNSEPLVSASTPITVESGLVSTALDLDLTTLPDNTPLVLTAVLAGDGQEIVDSVSFMPADLWGHAADSVQFVHLEPVESMANGPLPALLFDGRVAYHLSDAYESGSFSLSTRYQSAAGNGGGGGGGGGQPLSPGVGLVWLRFGGGGDGLTADNWAERLTVEATLYGVTAAGERVVVDTAVYSPE